MANYKVSGKLTEPDDVTAWKGKFYIGIYSESGIALDGDGSIRGGENVLEVDPGTGYAEIDLPATAGDELYSLRFEPWGINAGFKGPWYFSLTKDVGWDEVIALPLPLAAPYRDIDGTDSRRTQQLIDAGRAGAALNDRKAATIYADTRSTLYFEDWNNLTDGAWSSNRSNMQLVSGELAANSNSATSSMARALNLKTGQKWRRKGTVRPQSGPSGQLIIGICEGAAGANPANGGTDIKGITFDSGGKVRKWTNGTAADLSNTTLWTNGDVFDVTMVFDGKNLSIVAINETTGDEFRATHLGPTMNNDAIYLAETAGTTRRVRPFVSIPEYTSATPRSTTLGGVAYPIEDRQRTVVWSKVDAGGVANAAGVRLALPSSWDGRNQMPTVLCFHGHGTDETAWWENGNYRKVANAFNAAGWAVLSAANGTTTWGADASLDGYAAAASWARNLYNAGPFVVFANSMGSIEALLTLAQNRIPGIYGYIGTSPTYSLSDAYANAAFTSAITTAYGITAGTLSGSTAVNATSIPTTASFPTVGTRLLVGNGTANAEIVTTTGASTGTSVAVTAMTLTHASAVQVSDYPTKTSGHDPALLNAALFRGLPSLVLAASDDTTVPETTNAVPLIAALQPYSGDVLSKLDNTGGHSFDPAPYLTGTSPYDIVDRAKRCVGL